MPACLKCAKLRKPQYEQMFSALPPKADIPASSWRLQKGLGCGAPRKRCRVLEALRGNQKAFSKFMKLMHRSGLMRREESNNFDE
jgi:hypothetical protein